MKKQIGALALAALMVTGLAACGGNNSSDPTTSSQSGSSSFDTTQSISVVSREDGSGTRSAFIELFGIEEEDASGNKVDQTTPGADITNSTSVMMTTISSTPYAIGYISLGSLNDTVKAVKIDGNEASVENVKNGSYKVARPFNIATKSDISEVAQDFIDFILSAEGQAVVEENGYVSVVTGEAYAGNQPSGKVVIAGSSSVTPVMEKLKEAYLQVNPNATIEVQQSDSTAGMTSAIDGICDIGMASRDLKDSEKEKGLTATVIAMDGIAVIVNPDNTVDDLTSEQVKSIFKGETTVWSDVIDAAN